MSSSVRWYSRITLGPGDVRGVMMCEQLDIALVPAMCIGSNALVVTTSRVIPRPSSDHLGHPIFYAEQRQMENPRIPIATRHEGEYVLAAHQLYNDQSGISRQPDLATLSQLHLVLVDRECIASSIVTSNVVETGNLPGAVLPGHFKAFWADQPLSILHTFGSLINILPRNLPTDERARCVQTSSKPLSHPPTTTSTPKRPSNPSSDPSSAAATSATLTNPRSPSSRRPWSSPATQKNSTNEN